MLRFCGEKIVNTNQELKVAMEEQPLGFGEHIWEKPVTSVRRFLFDDAGTVYDFPYSLYRNDEQKITDLSQKVIYFDLH